MNEPCEHMGSGFLRHPKVPEEMLTDESSVRSVTIGSQAAKSKTEIFAVRK
jgi:hypothetical protein